MSKQQERRNRPGMRVLIAKDLRDGGLATGHFGTYLGRYWLLSEKRYRGPRDHLLVNPLIRLDDGTRIWGIECWWIPARETRP